LVLRYRTRVEALIFDKAACLAQNESVVGGVRWREALTLWCWYRWRWSAARKNQRR